MSKRIAVIVIFAFLLIGAFLQNSFIRNTTDYTGIKINIYMSVADKVILGFPVESV